MQHGVLQIQSRQRGVPQFFVVRLLLSQSNGQ
jgi:hypothetical protein